MARMQEEGLQNFLMQAIIIPGKHTDEGTLVESVAVPWFELIALMQRDPNLMYQIDWRKWEEMVAAAYERSGFEEVTLTPRSGDYGRDVIAVKRGVGCIRIIDQVKAFAPGNLVKANDVRAILGVLAADRQASKAVITTTSAFAPGVVDDISLKPFIPFRLELKSGPALLKWLGDVAARNPIR